MINVALLGFGRIGQMHAENINKNKDLKLLYVYEKIELLCKKAKKQYNCIIEKNYNNIFQDKNVDIIFIASPTSTHIKFIEEALKKNFRYCKNIFDREHVTSYIRNSDKFTKKSIINQGLIFFGGYAASLYKKYLPIKNKSSKSKRRLEYCVY